MMYLKEQDVKKKKSKQIQELPLSSAIRKRGKRDSRQMWRQGRVLLKQGQCLDNSRNGKINDEEKAFEKIQHTFMIKMILKNGHRRNLPQHSKGHI